MNGCPPVAVTLASGEHVTRLRRLPDEQKDELAVFGGWPTTTSAALSEADHVRKEVWGARIQSWTSQKVLPGP